MQNLTVIEWLKEQQLTDKEIDFVLTFIPGLSVLLVDKSKALNIFKMLKEQFPDFSISENDDYLQFKTLDFMFQNNFKKTFLTEELLKRMSEQGICKPVSDFILISKE